MPSFDSRQGASAFNQPLSFDTSSVTNMQTMFNVRCSPCPAPNEFAAAPSLARCVRRGCPPPAAPRPVSLAAHAWPCFYSRQQAYAFNQPLSFDTSSVTSMGQMFYVRFTPLALLPICSQALLCTRCVRRGRLPPAASWREPRPAPYALRSTLGSKRMRSTSR